MRKKRDRRSRLRCPQPAAPVEPKARGCARREMVARRSLTLRNRHPNRDLNLPVLRRIVQALLREMWPDASIDLGIYIVEKMEMAHVNQTFLHHQGSTDVITFNYTELAGTPVRRGVFPSLLHGEILLCLDEAIAQARRFRTTWQCEVIRYVVHGVLHLLGYDDQNTRARREMKEVEDFMVQHLARRFDLRAIGRSRS